jgi:uncharacterized protein (DUF433 family)
MSNTTPDYAVQSPEGGWRVAGTRVSLDSVVHAYWEGRLPEAIVADFPTLTLEQVHGAIAFYLRNRAEIDNYLIAQDARWRQFQQESASKHAPLLRRLRGAALSPTGD